MNKYIFLFVLIIFLLTGCFQQTIIMDTKNLSGNLYYSIKLVNDYVNTYNLRDKIDDVEVKSLLLLNKSELQKQISNSKKIKLISYIETNNDLYKTYDINLKFTEIDELKKLFNPFFIENTIYSEKDNIYCDASLILNFVGDPKKIKNQYQALSEEVKTTISAYLSLVKFRLIYILPVKINAQLSTNGEFSSEPVDEFTSAIFEKEILNNLVKDDKEFILSFYEKKLSGYFLKKDIDSDTLQQIRNILLTSGFKNKVIYEKSLLDMITSQKDPEFTVVYKKP
jgi:hypothetical protein